MQTWEPHVLRALERASREGMRKTARRIRIYETQIRQTSKAIVDSRRKNPYQMFIRMSSQEYLANPMCSQTVCGRILLLQKVSLFRRNIMGNTVPKLLRKIVTPIFPISACVRIAVYLSG